VLGRKIQIIQETAPATGRLSRKKKKLRQRQGGLDHGLLDSASRKAVLPVVEQYNGMSSYRPSTRGSRVQDVIYTARKRTRRSRRHRLDHQGEERQIVLLHRFPITSGRVPRTRSRASTSNFLKLKVRRREYFPLGTPSSLCHQQAEADKPDVIFTDVVGGFQRCVLQAAQGGRIDLSKQTLLTISVTEDEIDGIGGEKHRRRLRS